MATRARIASESRTISGAWNRRELRPGLHRHDVTFRSAKGGRNQSEIDRVLPASERRVMKWNGSPWEPDEGGNGGSEEDGAAWLIGYWAARYYKFIEE
jgi:hypothetical protein